MPDDTQPNSQNPLVNDGAGQPTQNQQPGQPPVIPADVERLVSEKVAAELKEIKTKLDGAYNVRDEALKRVKEFEAKEREFEIQRLKDQGKDREAFEAQLADANARIESLSKKNVELTRDVQLNGVLATLPFRNDMARQTAFRMIAENLVQNDKGEWVHKDGPAIADYVKAFSSNDETSFLFKQPVSSGTGSDGGGKPPAVSGEKKSLFDLSQSEVLKQVEEGRIVAPR